MVKGNLCRGFWALVLSILPGLGVCKRNSRLGWRRNVKLRSTGL
uniref:Uncharacterized protein n=1 Tax=Anguilla anguilla TaxID=7936 RepID=A0A0E9TSW8_ANGAN